MPPQTRKQATRIRVVGQEDGKVTVNVGGGASTHEFEVKNGVIEVTDPADVQVVLDSFAATVIGDDKPETVTTTTGDSPTG